NQFLRLGLTEPERGRVSGGKKRSVTPQKKTFRLMGKHIGIGKLNRIGVNEVWVRKVPDQTIQFFQASLEKAIVVSQHDDVVPDAFLESAIPVFGNRDKGFSSEKRDPIVPQGLHVRSDILLGCIVRYDDFPVLKILFPDGLNGITEQFQPVPGGN